METLELWFWPLLALILLPGLLVYLGLHIVERGVIFVDLALAQVSALGVAVAILMCACRRRRSSGSSTSWPPRPRCWCWAAPPRGTRRSRTSCWETSCS